MKRRRAPRTQLRDLVARTSIKALAKRFDRTPATIQRWLNAGPPTRVRDEIAEAYARSERARAGAEKRRAAQEAREAAERLKKELRAERAREAAASKRFEKFRKEEGPTFDGRTSGGHASLRAMIEEDDPTWLAFLTFAQSQGRTTREAYKQWFSPKLKKVTKKSKGQPKLKKAVAKKGKK
jgi:transposase